MDRTLTDRQVGFSTLERLEAIVANGALFELADAVPPADPSAGGRPRQYPVFMWVLFDSLLSVYGSGRRVEAELAHATVCIVCASWSDARCRRGRNCGFLNGRCGATTTCTDARDT